MSQLTSDEMAFIVERIIKNAGSAKKERDEKMNDDNKLFYDGLLQAYHEVIDTIRNRLIVYNVELKDYGLEEDPLY